MNIENGIQMHTANRYRIPALAAALLLAILVSTVPGLSVQAADAAGEQQYAWNLSDAAFRTAPADSAVVMCTIPKYTVLHYLGKAPGSYLDVTVNGVEGYVDGSLCTFDEEAVAVLQDAEEDAASEAAVAASFQTATQTAAAAQAVQATQALAGKTGTLTATAGTVIGPSGKETYYNMDMTKIVSNLSAKGYPGSYWIRDDGCKMFGDYILCAADYSLHPYGSLVQSSLGTCIVADTGAFSSSSATHLDIATNW